MSGPYGDILKHPHHVSQSRKPMSMEDRAAQFSPFAALAGHDAVIRETARLTEERIELAPEEEARLDTLLRRLAKIQLSQPEVQVTYFVPDGRKSGGAYITVKAKLWKVDPRRQLLVLEGGETVAFSQIYEIIPENANQSLKTLKE